MRSRDIIMKALVAVNGGAVVVTALLAWATPTGLLDDSRSGDTEALGVAAEAEGAKTYVSIDVDVLDISLVPGCVSAEPNGMAYGELSATLEAIAAHTNVVGFDFVEVNPQLDVPTGVTAYLGTHIVVEFLGFICDQPRWAAQHHRSE